MNLIKGAVIGFGKLGLLHLSQFQSFKNIQIKYICEYNDFIKKNLEKLFSNIKIKKDFKEIPIKDLDFVVVATPSAKHYEVIKYFLENKKHVFSEKPMVTNYQDSLDLQGLAIKNKVNLFTGYMYEFHDTFKKGIELISVSKVLGNIFFAKAEMYVSQYLKKKELFSWRFNKKESGGGVVITQTSHLIYFLCRLFGDINNVNSSLKNIYSQNNIEDYAHIILNFNNKVTASIDASWSVANYRTPYLKIFFEGENGNLTLTEDKISFFLKNKKETFAEGNNIIKIPEIKKGVSFDVAGSHYTTQAEHFINLIIGRKLDERNLNLSVQTQKIIEEIYANKN